MADFAKELIPVNLEDEMRKSYLDYAMSVIIGRALPDVRDGLKPVHRRALYAMHELGNDWNKGYKKSARIVGDVIGKYHPHGDTAVYDTIVRMAQPFSMRYPLVDGQGNFGSVDGDSPAAMRYTEIRMARIAHELLADIEKETVDFLPNYDGSEREPAVLPARIPNLLVNGASGIAVGMATNIPPHNLTEVINACMALIDNADCSIEDLMNHVPGPDFPTAAIINGASGIREAYETGRGKIYLRARAHFETDHHSGRDAIIVTELPYQVNKARLLEKIADLVKQKKLDGIAELRDESDKEGMRMVIEVKRGESADVVLNNLYQHTQMQNVFGINMVALDQGQPKQLNLKQLLEAFLAHRREIVTRRTMYELRKSRDRAHILEGLAVALTNIDEIIALIRRAENPAQAKQELVARVWVPGIVQEMLNRAGAEASRPDGLSDQYGLLHDGYHLSPEQAQAILDLRLHRLTGLEQDKLIQEFKEIIDKIADLLEILSNPDRLMNVIREELLAVRDQYGDARRSEILSHRVDLSLEDLIVEEDMVVTLSHFGYAKIQPLSDYRAQKRGGRGKSAADIKEEDFIENLLIANTHDTLLCFSSYGRVYWLKVYELPQVGRNARGKPIVNLLSLQPNEKITAILPVREYSDSQYVFFATAKGIVKKTRLSDFSRPRATGINAIELRDDDLLIQTVLTDGQRDIMLFSDAGKAIRFSETDVRAMGRTASGVYGMRLGKGQAIISLIVINKEDPILLATENGYGKRTAAEQFSKQGRGGQGVIAIQVSERNGGVVGAIQVNETDEAMLITDAGILVRIKIRDVSVLGRNTQGVRLIRLSEGERVSQLARIEADHEAEEDDSLEEESQ